MAIIGAGPFEIGDRNAAEKTAADGVDNLGMGEGGDVALTLQLGFLRIDAA
jgi:hypothetical protein